MVGPPSSVRIEGLKYLEVRSVSDDGWKDGTPVPSRTQPTRENVHNG